jgi:hypothetical protein
MKNLRTVVGLALAAALVIAGYLTLRGFGVLGAATAAVKAVPAGHQEIAWIAPATSDDTWERLVEAVRYLVRQWPELFPESPVLRANFEQAFLDLTAEVPEVSLWFQGRENAVLWLRWYKLASGVGTRAWLDKLISRQRPPLAIVGGDTSDRAVRMARTLQEYVDAWGKPAPLFLITTATADRFYRDVGGAQEGLTDARNPKLIDIYKKRSFRFAFTNTRMAEAIMEFLHEHTDVWLRVKSDPAYVAGIVGNGSPWTCLCGLAAGNYFQPQALYIFEWMDDRYSVDLADRFAKAFGAARPSAASDLDKIPYGVGDFNLPNPQEAQAAGRFLANTSGSLHRQHQILALPTTSQRARRFLRTVCATAPLESRNLVVISGDAIDFNDIYRDRNLAWNVLDMPVPLVLFCHRNPIAERVGFHRHVVEEDRTAETGTQDLLLFIDLFQALIQAAFQDGRLLADPDILHSRLQRTKWYGGKAYNPGFTQAPAGAFDLFNAEGDRNPHTGEHIVWLRPEFAGDQVAMAATITIWRIPSSDTSGRWRRVGQPLHVSYNTVAPHGNAGHAAD